ncbi:MAG: tetratricopeptide repeat protein [Planctomycetes bacterium]|nr:tetratricopeptide repeat protein [Planctomycetota bacterium]
MRAAGDAALRGAEVSITGRLASMTRPEAVGRISGVGARYVSMPRNSTDYLVVGRDGWPLASDGRLTNSLRAAERLQGSGVRIEVVAEESFLELLEPKRASSAAPRLYTIGELSRILRVAQREIRSWMRRGLITPARVEKRLAYFEFREVANARSLQRLLADGATPAQIRHSLDRLEQWLPGTSGPIGQLVESQGELLVRLACGGLAEPSGQLRLAFELDGGDVDTALPSIAQRSQQDWFVEGVRCEERGDLERAGDAYHEALLVGPARPEICFNLGNVLHSLRRKGEAAQRFMQAVELDPEYVEAWNNLGNTLAELGRSEKALLAYHRALELEPAYADAHFNLAATLEAMDRFEEAREHWAAYLRQDPNSADADFVRERLVQPVSETK